jgi:acyl-CoA hydrolase
MQSSRHPCSRCGADFVCKAEDIARCDCRLVTLTGAQLAGVAQQYDGCLCNACLLAISIQSAETAVQFKKTVMTLEERMAASETHIFKAVFPNTTNHYDTLFGGTAMQLMDEVAFIAATRFSRLQMVTVSSDRIDFKKPIPAGTIIELVGKVSYVGNTSLKVRVEIFIEQMYAEQREKAITGEFTFVAVDEHKKALRIPK